MADIIVPLSNLVAGGYRDDNGDLQSILIRLVDLGDGSYAIATTADGGGNPLPLTSGKAEDDILALDASLDPQWVTPVPVVTPSQVFSLNAQAVPADATVQYAPISGTISNATFGYPTQDPTDPTQQLLSFANLMPKGGTLKRLFIYISGNNSAVGAYVFTVIKNGVASSLSVSIAGTGSGAAVTATDTVHTLAVSAGDLLALKIDFSTEVGGTTDFIASLEFDPS